MKALEYLRGSGNTFHRIGSPQHLIHKTENRVRSGILFMLPHDIKDTLQRFDFHNIITLAALQIVPQSH